MESTHTEAMKYDGEKVRLDLLPVQPIIEIGKVLTYGAKKYSERNWEKGLAWSRCYGAALRHLLAWQSGETNDPETGLNHLAHAACEILFLLEFSRTHPELDDRPNNFAFNELFAKARERDAVKPESTPSPDPLAWSWIDCVKQFNRAYGVPVWCTVDSIDEYMNILTEQMDLIDEEHRELTEAYKAWKAAPYKTAGDEIPILDAICDSIYVLIGLALKMGFDLDKAFLEVHRSNMSKLGADGKPIKREDGKILKGPNFTPPKLDAFI